MTKTANAIFAEVFDMAKSTVFRVREADLVRQFAGTIKMNVRKTRKRKPVKRRKPPKQSLFCVHSFSTALKVPSG